jgi:hypothetical protein
MKYFLAVLLAAPLIALSVAPLHAQEPLTQDQIHRIAARSAGEARASGPDGVGLVACTIYNRMKMGYGSLDAVLTAYYAPDWEPTLEETDAVEDWLTRCPTRLRYALSSQDIRKWAFPAQAADAVAGAQNYKLHFYTDWLGCNPWERTC